jgi:ATP-dependent DNA ligase
VAKLFQLLCTSRELQRDPELSRYTIPFVFRSDRVANVWTTMKSGRRGEFDVLIRGTFRAFDTIAKGKGYLDLVIPIESKYTVVTAEHVTGFDEKIRKVFGDARNIMPIMVGLSWKQDALTLAKRFGFMPIYFSSLNNLISVLTGTGYRLDDEWKRVEERLNKGEISLEELRKKINSLEIKYEFEGLIEERLGKELERPKAKSVREIKDAPTSTAPEREELKPMLAFHADTIGEILSRHPIMAWEPKIDGIRLLAVKEDGGVRLLSRKGTDLTGRYPSVAEEVRGLEGDLVLDGELLAVDGEGRPLPSQKLLENGGDYGLMYYIFDLLRLDGEDLRGYSYEERRRILEERLSPTKNMPLVDRMISADEKEILELFHHAKEQGHEGLVAKSLSSPYTPGRRRPWFKYKGKPDTLDLVAIGVNYSAKKRGIGSLLLAARQDGVFHPVGKVGTGFKKKDIDALERLLTAHLTRTRPKDVVSGDKPDRWLRPGLVVEVSHEGIARSKRYGSGYSLRFPRFMAAREDKDPRDACAVKDLRRLLP